jgi:hypothetical protein
VKDESDILHFIVPDFIDEEQQTQDKTTQQDKTVQQVCLVLHYPFIGFFRGTLLCPSEIQKFTNKQLVNHLKNRS